MVVTKRATVVVVVAGVIAVIGISIALVLLKARPDKISVSPDLTDSARVLAGQPIYDRHCAACHGANLEGQPNWTTRLPSGRMPAPPHDASGHTWHHPSDILFALTKYGLQPPHAPANYASDMPAFGNVLTDDEIWNVLAFIRSRWPESVRDRHGQLDRHYAEQKGRSR
jgi:mono/diheme cytochrome c family protein